MKALLAGLALGLLVAPALAVEPSATSVTCAAAVTTGIGGQQELHDLEPSDLPVLAYAELPKDKQFKPLTKIGDEAIGLYVYRVNDKLLHMQIFEPVGDGKAVLSDTPLVGDTSELTWAPLGGKEQVTVYCY
jgi:hypothetical protein